MEKITFKEIDVFRPNYLSDINHLLSQLSNHPVNLEETDLRDIISSTCSRLFMLLHEEHGIGMISLCSYKSPTGTKAWIEDVVIDSAFRNKGLGRLMMKNVVDIVRCQGDATIMLTSRPSRIAANQLYQSLGFEKKETNVYKMKF